MTVFFDVAVSKPNQQTLTCARLLCARLRAVARARG